MPAPTPKKPPALRGGASRTEEQTVAALDELRRQLPGLPAEVWVILLEALAPDADEEPRKPAKTKRTREGSAERLAWLVERIRRGEALFHPGDRPAGR